MYQHSLDFRRVRLELAWMSRVECLHVPAREYACRTPAVSPEPQAPGQRFFLKVYGCQMNQYEAGIVRTILAQAGYRETYQEEDADVLLMLTCAVRSHAEQRALGRLGTFRRIRSLRPGRVVGVLGCMSQVLKDALVQDSAADLIVGPDQYRLLPELINKVRNNSRPVVAVGQTNECYEGIIPSVGPAATASPCRREGIVERAVQVCGLVTVMRGCDNYCSYCIVPHARGRERSKPLNQVLAEVRAMTENGTKDITLLGQNVLAYRADEHDFVSLLEQVSMVPGIERVRFLTSHPRDLTDRVLTAIASIPKVCPSLHLPVQSGSNRILALMNRGYTREEYLDKVARARKLIPGLSLTTDVMVGFPSETDADFADTLELIRNVRFDFAYMFRFSARPGTVAAGLSPKVSEAESSRRLARLIDVQNRITKERNSEMVGQGCEILIERPSPRGTQMLGRTPQNRVVIVSGPCRPGDTVRCRVTGIKGWTPLAQVIQQDDKFLTPNGH